MPRSLSENAPSELFEGRYYSIADGDVFSIAKILKLESDKVHVRIYKQHFPRRPRSIDVNSLTMGTTHDKDGCGIGHLPLRLTTFQNRQPMFLTYSEVKAEELEGYKVFTDVGGQVWE
jgi:hypothetical protein